MQDLLKLYAVRAVIAFLTAAVAVVTAAGVDVIDADVLEAAAVGGIGAALRVVQSGLEAVAKRYTPTT